MPQVPRWRLQIEGIIKFGIRDHFPATPDFDDIVAELQADVRRLLEVTDLGKALNSVIRLDILPTHEGGPEGRLIPLEYRVITRNKGVAYKIVKKSTIPFPEVLPNNIITIGVSETYYLKITILEKPPGMPSPMEWYYEEIED